MVFLVDELEQRGLVERTRNPADRRSYSLFLTEQGRQKLAAVQEAGLAQQNSLASPFTAAEREQLTALLRRLAADHGLSEQSLPGIRRRG